MDTDQSHDNVRRAWALLRDRLSGGCKDVSGTIQDLCTSYPDLESVLKALETAFRAGQAAAGSRSFHAYVRDQLGDAADELTVVLDSGSDNQSPRAAGATITQQDSDRYAVQDEVARGGMGVIYRVRDTELNRTLAMKVMAAVPAESTDNPSVTLLSRFLEEAQLTAQLDHPGIASVHELGIDDQGRPFFTMKLIKGREFSRIVDLVRETREGWNLSRAVSVLVKVCQTTAYAHSKRVIHRDLKPANIMVGRFGEVYVMDWGLAKVVGRQDSHDLRLRSETQPTFTQIRTPRSSSDSSTADSPLITMDGSVVGTPAFMAPEQARGDLEAVNHQSDTYSLGAVLYHLLTGQPPYVEPGTRISPRTVLARVLDGPPKPISELNREVPSELTAICEKAMARDKSSRYESSLDLAEDLQAWLDHRVVRAYHTGPIAELKSWVNRNRLAAILGTSSLVVLLLLAGLWTNHERKNSVLLSHRLAQQYLRQGQWFSERGDIDRGLHWLVRASQECPATSASLLTDIETNLFLWSERCNRLVQILDHEGGIAKPFPAWEPLALAFSPDGNQLVTGGFSNHTAKIWSIETGKPIGAPMEHGDSVNAVFWTSNGERIITASEDTVRLWSNTGHAVQEPIQVSSRISSLEFNPAASIVAVAADDGTVTLWSATNGQAIGDPMRNENSVTALGFGSADQLLVGYSDGSARVWSVDSSKPSVGANLQKGKGVVRHFSPDGLTMLVVNEESVGQLWSIERAESIGSPLKHDSVIELARFSPNGAVVVTVERGLKARLWSTKGGTPIGLPLNHRGRIASLAFSSDSQLLLTGSMDLSARLWSTSTGERVGIEIATGQIVSGAVFSADASQIAFSASGQAEVWSADVFPRPKAAFAATPNLWAIGFNPKGSQIVVGGSGELRTWSKDTAELLFEFPDRRSTVWDAQYSPDGQRIVVGYASGQARIWSVNGEDEVVLNHEGAVRSVAFNSTGTLVATGSFDRIAKVWNAVTGECVLSLAHPGIVEDLVFLHDGKSLVTACDDGKVRIWSLRNGTEIRPSLEHSDAVLAVDVSPDGRIVATGSRDNTARFWVSATGRQTGPILEHANWVEDLSFGPEGRFIVTGCTDGNVQLWSVDNGEKIGPAWPHLHPVRAVAFDPRGGHVLTGAEDARLWAMPEAAPERLGDLEIWIQAMTGKQIDRNGVLSRLSPSQWRSLGQVYSDNGP